MSMRNMVGRGTLSAYRIAHRAWAKAFSLAVGGAFASFGRRSVIEPPVRIAGERGIAVGDDVWVGGGSWLQTLHGTGEVALEIGDGTIAGGCVISAARSVRLGKKVLVARGVYISDHNHRYDDVERAVLDQGLANVAAVEVCDGAWLGENVVVCPGVRIGRGAVVGANSVVTRSIPDHSLAVGAPARVVRHFGAPHVAAVG